MFTRNYQILSIYYIYLMFWSKTCQITNNITNTLINIMMIFITCCNYLRIMGNIYESSTLFCITDFEFTYKTKIN